MRNDDFYVYGLFYPVEMGSNVFYIGKGHERRIYAHEGEARTIYYCPDGIKVFRCFCPKCIVIRGIWKQGYAVVRKRLHENLSTGQASGLEQSEIRKLGSSRILTNRQSISSRNRIPHSKISSEVRIAEDQFLKNIDLLFAR